MKYKLKASRMKRKSLIFVKVFEQGKSEEVKSKK